MSQQHSNTKKRSFQHLTPYQRGQIQALIEQRIPKVHIAKQVGIARSTLYEELKRGTVDQMRSDLTYYKRYFADTGQLVYMRRREASRKPFKLSTTAPFLKYLEKKCCKTNFLLTPSAAEPNFKACSRLYSAQRRFTTISTLVLFPSKISISLFV